MMWLPIAVRTLMGAASGKMFFAPCLGTDLFLRRAEERKKNPKGGDIGGDPRKL